MEKNNNNYQMQANSSNTFDANSLSNNSPSLFGAP